MELIAEILISAVLVICGVFALVGSYGLVKLDDLMKRLHAPTKASTLGVGGALVASMLYFGIFQDSITVHELLVTLFILMTAPITANMIAKAHLHLTGADAAALPPTGTAEGWATYDTAPTLEAAEREAAARTAAKAAEGTADKPN